MSQDKKADLTVIVLTKNEARHIARCIESLRGVARHVIVVDSFSTDATVQIARDAGAEVHERKFRAYADQFNWAISQLPIRTEWVMRLDADEVWTPELAEELRVRLENVPLGVNGFVLKRRMYFYDRWIRHGAMFPMVMLRIWRRGYGHIECRWMDEHTILSEGRTLELEGHISDINHNGLDYWFEKHLRYARSEMADVVIRQHGLSQDTTPDEQLTARARIKRFFKMRVYYGLPMFVRPTLYFLYRYVFRLGFLDGSEGLVYHFLQGFWYRLLVDIRLWEFARLRARNPELDVATLLKSNYGIDVVPIAKTEDEGCALPRVKLN